MKVSQISCFFRMEVVNLNNLKSECKVSALIFQKLGRIEHAATNDRRENFVKNSSAARQLSSLMTPPGSRLNQHYPNK